LEIKLDHYNGREGVVEYIDGLDQLHGTWGGLAVIPGEDKFEVIQKSCAICGQLVDGYGSNPMPLRGDVCCDTCNINVVIPFRLFWSGNNPNHAMILGEDNSISFIKPQDKFFTLQQLQKAVKGYIEVHPEKVPKHLILVNEEGLLMKMKSNRLAELAFSVQVVGPTLICPAHLME